MILLLAAALAAHDTPVKTDLGTVVRIDREFIEIECSVTLSRAAAFLEAVEMDADGDGRLSPAEQAATFARAGRRLEEGLEILLNGVRVRPERVGDVALEMPFTKRYRFRIPQPAGWREGAELEIHNECFLDRSGDVTMEVVSGEGVDVRIRGRKTLERDARIGYRAGTGQKTRGMASTEGVVEPPSTGWIWIAAVLLLVPAGVAWRRRRRPALRIGIAAVSGAAIVVLVLTARTVDEPEAVRLFLGLHEPFARAQAEGRTGDRDGTRFEVRRIKPLETAVTAAAPWSGPGFTVKHRWRVYGIESHELHRHARVDEYTAVYTIGVRDGAWRITSEEPVKELPVTALR